MAEEIRYVPGESFKCFKRKMISVEGELGPECGAEIVMHGYHWCAQVCPTCLANYFPSFGTNPVMRLDHGFYPPADAAKVRATIAANGGQYVPQFR